MKGPCLGWAKVYTLDYTSEVKTKLTASYFR